MKPSNSVIYDKIKKCFLSCKTMNQHETTCNWAIRIASRLPTDYQDDYFKVMSSTYSKLLQ